MSKKLIQAAAGAGGESVYVEDVFSTYLYEGTTAAGNTVNNGIDLDGEGGMVWLKSRGDAQSHGIFDTERGTGKLLSSDTTSAELPYTDITAFNSNGFTLGYYTGWFNSSSYDQCSWSFRKQAGFFDVVTYTGDGTSAREIAHNLGCKPAIIIVKNLDQTYEWAVWHKSFDVNEYDSAHMHLNTTDASTYTGTPFPSQLNVGSRDPSANFYVHNNSMTNTNGVDYVAYLFADGADTDAQIFGDDSDESIIKCGSFTTDGSGNATVNLGWEPQFLIHKRSDSSGSWYMYDVSRSWTAGSGAKYLLYANLSNAENQLSSNSNIALTSTGFDVSLNANETDIYIAIRRPMKTPEAGSDVLAINTRAGYTGSEQEVNTTIVPDLVYINSRDKTNEHWGILSTRLQGAGKSFFTTGTYAEISDTTEIKEFGPEQTSITLGSSNTVGENGVNFVDYYMKRATGFMDVVAYTGTGSATTISHNLGVVPELLIIKNRSGASDSWVIYDKFADLTTSTPLFSDFKTGGRDYPKLSINSTAPTASVFSIGPAGYSTNTSGVNYIAYMWASVAGVSKIGSYSGTGSNVDVDCGFSAGARFVMITRSDSGGNWYVWDSARGIVAGNDPYLQIGEQDAEVTNTDYIDPLNAGFTVTSSAPAALNASGGTYIFLAIA